MRQIDHFSTQDEWKIGFEIVYRLHVFTQGRALDHGGKLNGLKQAFKSAFGLEDSYYELDQIGHAVSVTVYWRVLWDKDAFNLKLLEKRDDNLNKFAEQNGISIIVLETTIIPRSLGYISQRVSMPMLAQ
ncbi:MAG: hypothetical protein ABR886_12315 [Dehalococcoidales bacterium]